MARLIFIGAGAVGTYLGGWLSHVGHDVTLVEHWTEQVEKITSDGLAISGPHESFVAHPRMVHLHESEKLAREKPFEVILDKTPQSSIIAFQIADILS